MKENIFRTQLPKEELLSIIQSLPTGEKEEAKTEPPPAPSEGEVLSGPEKRIRNLKKKLDQVVKLKEKQAKGEKIEKNQVIINICTKYFLLYSIIA